MRLSITIIAGAYRASDREIIMRQPFREQPGDVIVQVTAEDIGNRPYTQLIADMLRAAESSLQRQLSPIIKEVPSDH